MSSNIDRRAFLLSLPGVAVLPRIVTLRGTLRNPRVLPALALNHVALRVSDPSRSVAFYQELLGMPIQARRGRTTLLRLGDGPQFVAIEAGEAPSISRMGIAVADFDVDRAVQQLLDSGLTSVGDVVPSEPAMRVWTVTRGPQLGGDPGGTREVYFGDPHGIVVQVVDRGYCGGSGPLGTICPTAEPLPVPGRLSARDLNHFTNGVSDSARAIQFYQELFGLPVQAYQASTPALGVGGGPQFVMFGGGGGGAQPVTPPRGSIGHVCMTVEGFETEEILATLADYGIPPRAEGESSAVPLRSSVSMRMPNRGGAPGGTPELYFSDPDGLRIQLQDPTYCGGGGILGSVC